MAAPAVGVLVMAYGTPRSPTEIEPYYTDIRRGRPPTPEALADLTRRYEAIGGVSPLARHTESQAAAIQRSLDDLHPGRYQVAIGLKHAAPEIEVAAAELAARGCGTVVGLVLAPHYSSASVGQYLERAGAVFGDLDPPIPFHGIRSWAREPALIHFLAQHLDSRRRELRAAGHERVAAVFTAHSLPQRVIDGGDPYADELHATAELVAGGLDLAWSTAWQSAGRTPEPWLGPDVGAVLERIATEGTTDAVVVCPCGFVADHLEVLYDIDIEVAPRAAALGLSIRRTPSINDDPAVMRALADRIAQLAP